MKRLSKYKGINPALYACYDENGRVSTQRTRELTRYLINKGVEGLYVGGSSGECIYQSIDERKRALESVVDEACGQITIIAHVACNNTQDSMELARHAQSLEVDAIAAIPPIYFKLPSIAIAQYWNDISMSADGTDFIIYNIPQLTGIELDVSLLKNMLENPNIIGVKNSSMHTVDISEFKRVGGDDFVVFNGPDEQYISGRAAGAVGGIGGTYGVMIELFIKLEKLFSLGDLSKARELQNDINTIIWKLCDGQCSMYAMIKEVLRIRKAIDIGGVRKPLFDVCDKDKKSAEECSMIINNTIEKFL